MPQKRVKVSRFVSEVSYVLSGKNPQEISKNEEPTLQSDLSERHLRSNEADLGCLIGVSAGFITFGL